MPQQPEVDLTTLLGTRCLTFSRSLYQGRFSPPNVEGGVRVLEPPDCRTERRPDAAFCAAASQASPAAVFSVRLARLHLPFPEGRALRSHLHDKVTPACSATSSLALITSLLNIGLLAV